jgi:hypothetical protein
LQTRSVIGVQVEVMMRPRQNTGTIVLILGMTLASLPAAAEPIRVLGGM